MCSSNWCLRRGVGVSKGPQMELWLDASRPTVFLSLTPCLENPIMEGGRARL